jgi:hypothetical protein
MADYCTVDDLADFMHVVDDAERAQFEALIGEASRLIDAHTKFSFEPAASTATARVFVARFEDLLFCDPISSTTDLVVETQDMAGGSWTTWAAADYQLEPLNRRSHGIDAHPFWSVRAVGCKAFPVGQPARVRITARWGWADGTPELVVGACKTIVKAMQQQRTSAAEVAVIGEGMASRIYMVSKDAAQRLRPVTRPDAWT